ncbi:MULTISPECIES: helix-turn-helix transcriptional regulator [Erwiniaceae]|uniref:AlpA family phage regulatory protein n=2 Tax=Erwiniaceae TaxID=1903409 RepID=A0ACC5PQ61_ENTAG|nr:MULTISPECIES: AlpA family phage regulatory protein [Erwiniaceae]MBD8127128.1 AlpA family phage regulatory protein [Pantoea agglomerans]TKJ93865.1 hypothetical protein EpCFBP13511_04695 [Erwinia persicina]
MSNVIQTVNILRVPALVKKLGIGRSTVYDWLDPDSDRFDPTFPQRVKLGAKAVGWLESEIDAWVLSKTKQPLTPVSP